MVELGPHAHELHTVMMRPLADAEARLQPRVQELSPQELGALLPSAYKALNGDESDPARFTAFALIHADSDPEFTPAQCAELFRALATRSWGSDVQVAAAALARCPEPYDREALAAPARTLTRKALDSSAGQAVWAASPEAFLAVAACAPPELAAQALARIREEFATSPLRLALLEDGARGGPRTLAGLAELGRSGIPVRWPVRRDETTQDDPEGSRHIRRVLEAGAAHLAAIHEGRVPYVSDKAFPPADCEALARAACAALSRDEPWAGELLAELLPRASVAPTAAKTLPSQSACIRLAHAVEEYPTPEAVDVLREARRVVRHAGVAKKLDRSLRRAERALGRRPDAAIRLPDLGIAQDGTVRTPVGAYVAVLTVSDTADLAWERADGTRLRSLPAPARRHHADVVAAARDLLGKVRAQIRTLTRALEGTYTAATTYRYGRWREGLAAHPVGRSVTARLIWEYADTPGRWTAFLPADGLPALDDATAVRLWHPVRATPEERAYWRDRVVAGEIAQPFRQAFRESYVPEETGARTDVFAGFAVQLGPLLGVAKGEGWDGEYDGIGRSFGGTEVFLDTGRAYAGMTGWSTVGPVIFGRPIAELDAVSVSEALRAVDLLVSVGAFAVEEEYPAGSPAAWRELDRLGAIPLTQTTRVRREALARVLAPHISAGRIEVTDRQVRVAGHDVHLATGRVTKDGEQAEVGLPRRRGVVPLPFLPYDEKLLERVLYTVEALLADGGPRPGTAPERSAGAPVRSSS
ncbi:DUF4132 domain-containing protein [Streptomyces sp. NPDC051940]|uniref:DUF4132 domain-containing protein n=1 Tax=Streptomyces sp. NPDC051940 TaxID=3155675 RepID=UPI00342467C5